MRCTAAVVALAGCLLAGVAAQHVLCNDGNGDCNRVCTDSPDGSSGQAAGPTGGGGGGAAMNENVCTEEDIPTDKSRCSQMNVTRGTHNFPIASQDWVYWGAPPPAGRGWQRNADWTRDHEFMRSALIQEEGTAYTYFLPDPGCAGDGRSGCPGKCVQYGRDDPLSDAKDPMKVPQGCAPFASEGECTLACEEWIDNLGEELTEELEEEAVELGLFLYHFSIMFYMCLGLALVCEDFFVASLEIIIDKLQLPPDVAGATFMAAGSSSPELFVATVAVFMVGDAGQRCALKTDRSDTDYEFASNCGESPEEQLGWFATPDAMATSGDYVGSAAAAEWVDFPAGDVFHAGDVGAKRTAQALDDVCGMLTSVNGGHGPLGQKIYIDEGVGVGAVVGSTMFNTLCIIGGSAIVSGKISKLDWRIVMRDGTSYMLGIFMLAYILNFPNKEVEPVLAFFNKEDGECTNGKTIELTNSAAEGLMLKHGFPCPVVDGVEFTGTCYQSLHGLEGVEAGAYCEPKIYGLTADGSAAEPLGIVTSNESLALLAGYMSYVLLCAMYGRIMDKVCPAYGNSNQIGFAEMGAATTSFDAQDKTNRPTVDGFEAYKKTRQLQNRRTVVARQLVGAVLRGEVEYDQLTGGANAGAVSSDGYAAQSSEGLSNGVQAGESHAQQMMDSKLFDSNIVALDDIPESARGSVGDAETGQADHGDVGGSPTEHEEHVHNIWEVPKGKAKIFWAMSFPLMVVFTYTIPDCRRTKFKTWYVGTFAMSIVWMGALVEVMVDNAIEAFHEALHIPMGPLGLTFVAAGTSFPDFLASMLVAKKGLADMAVSNAFGSNIFDVLLGLGWPWMMQTTLVDPGAVLFVGSMDGLNSSFGLLVVSYFIWLFVLSCVKWNLAPLMGVVMSLTYVIWAVNVFASG